MRAVALPSFAALLAAMGAAVVTNAGEGTQTATAAAAPSGEALIRAAQRRLGVTADGIVGPVTRAAVRSFQSGRGLPTTGQLDDATLVALGVISEGLTVLETTVASGVAADTLLVEQASDPPPAPEVSPTTTPTPGTMTTTPSTTTTAPSTTTTPSASADEATPPPAVVVGGAPVGMAPTIVGGQLPDDAGLSPVPPRDDPADRPPRRPKPEVPEQAGLSPRPPTTTGPSASAELRVRLERIARCESGGNPRAVSANGLYRGKYQFSRPTWRSVGGRGDPAAATEAEQDRRAAILYKREGAAPWPVCGRR